MIKHIVSFSGGKDSTAMLLMMIEKNMQIDEIIFCDTSKEFDEMYAHIDKVEKYINRPITRLQADYDFDYYMFDHVKTRGKNKGSKGYGWYTGKNKWCTQLLKKSVIDKYLRNYKKQGYTIIEYHGIAYDEPERIDKNKEKNVQYPLYEWGIVEVEALQYCYDKGFDWNGLYEYFKRVSCWCCPQSSLLELKNLFWYFPEKWNQLKDMDERSINEFRLDYSLSDLEKRFMFELDIQIMMENYKDLNPKLKKAIIIDFKKCIQ